MQSTSKINKVVNFKIFSAPVQTFNCNKLHFKSSHDPTLDQNFKK